MSTFVVIVIVIIIIYYLTKKKPQNDNINTYHYSNDSNQDEQDLDIDTYRDVNFKKVIKELDLSYYSYLGKETLSDLLMCLYKYTVKGELTDRKYEKCVEEKLPEEYKAKAKVISMTIYNIYSQKSHDKSAYETQYNNEDIYWEYVGAEDDLNRDICIWALDKRFFTDQERKEFEKKYGVREGCRHNFVEITKYMYDNKER